MTAIVGLVHDGQVYVGGDSAGVAGLDLMVRSDPKVFTLPGGYVVGFTSSFRMGQVIRYAFTPPPGALVAKDLHGFMCTKVIDGLREALKLAGWATKDQERESAGTLLVGVAGRLFRIESDYQVGEAADGYDAVGCGAQVAMGALFASRPDLHITPWTPPERVVMALEAAERFSAGVRGPFTVAVTGPLPEGREPTSAEAIEAASDPEGGADRG
jgi:hypothetical protein